MADDEFYPEKSAKIVVEFFDIHPRFFYLARLKKIVLSALKINRKWQKKPVHYRQEGKV